jgi:FlaA1/EpsC-like NDP-sugar epimerase
MNELEREAILDREEHQQLVHLAEGELEWDFFKGKNFLVTGSEGSLGVPLVERLRSLGANVVTLDIVKTPNVNVDADIRSYPVTVLKHRVHQKMKNVDYIYHLAADKHAPAGEITPQNTVDINITGMTNMMEAFPDAHMILASTCKAADPETVYGATKMIAERIVLDDGGTVARFYNVPETSGNVFEIWNRFEDVMEVTTCTRYFISKREAIGLLIAMPQVPPGRYTVDPVCQRYMVDIVQKLYPERHFDVVPPRRGDRIDEPKKARSEHIETYMGNIAKIISMHDKDF